MSAKPLDCFLLSYGSNYFLVPCIAIAEVIYFKDAHPHPLSKSMALSINWRDQVLPCINMDETPLKQHGVKQFVAVINALFSQDANICPYFAVVLEEKPKHVVLQPSNIKWKDEKALSVTLTLNDGHEERAQVLDINALSCAMETVIKTNPVFWKGSEDLSR